MQPTARQDEAPAASRYLDRAQAGRAVAAELGRLAGRDDVVVLAIPRGGVATGYEIARSLGLPLDVLVVLRLGLPGYEAVAAGAVARPSVRVMNPTFSDVVPPEAVERATRRAERELERLERLFRSERPPLDVAGQNVVVVDDGMASGTTMRAAVRAVRQQSPASVLVATPVASREAIGAISDEVDEIVCLHIPEPFGGVSASYGDFRQVDDATVCDLLDRGAGAERRDHPRRSVLISGAHGLIEADLTRPRQAIGIVLMAGNGTPRFVHGLNDAGLATLSFTHRAELADLERAIVWAAADPATTHLRVGLFGGNDAATAALAAAAHRADVVGAVVLQSACVDRAATATLSPVVAPTLLLAGARDPDAPVRNRQAASLLRGAARVAIVVGASETFEEPGTADEAARLAAEWFRHYL